MTMSTAAENIVLVTAGVTLEVGSGRLAEC